MANNGAMTKPDAPHQDRPRKRRGRIVVWALLVLMLLPIVGVLVHAVVPPPMTILMAEQAVRGRGLDYRWRNLDAISPNLVHAAIASEDSRFCSHMGFDMEAIEKALQANRDGGRIRGGSTISQQTAKNVFLWPGRDWVRKGLEAGYTVLIEAVWPKRRIVEVYLNVAEFAPGVYGAEAGAQHWFGVSAADLTPLQAARMAAVLPSPRRYDAASPGPYVRRRTRAIQGAARVVRNDGLAACVTG